MSTALVTYSIDSSALIHGWQRAYRPKSFAVVWDHLDGLVQAGRLKGSVEVLRELEKRDDELAAWCKARQEAMFVEIDDDCQREVARIMGAYPRLVDTVKGRSTADPFVIALASSARPGMTVVSEEAGGKQRMPDVCQGIGVPYLNLADLIEKEGWTFR